MWNKLKQLLCRHKLELYVGTYNYSSTVEVRCYKCQKKVGAWGLKSKHLAGASKHKAYRTSRLNLIKN